MRQQIQEADLSLRSKKRRLLMLEEKKADSAQSTKVIEDFRFAGAKWPAHLAHLAVSATKTFDQSASMRRALPTR